MFLLSKPPQSCCVPNIFLTSNSVGTSKCFIHPVTKSSNHWMSMMPSLHLLRSWKLMTISRKRIHAEPYSVFFFNKGTCLNHSKRNSTHNSTIITHYPSITLLWWPRDLTQSSTQHQTNGTPKAKKNITELSSRNKIVPTRTPPYLTVNHTASTLEGSRGTQPSYLTETTPAS